MRDRRSAKPLRFLTLQLQTKMSHGDARQLDFARRHGSAGEFQGPGKALGRSGDKVFAADHMHWHVSLVEPTRNVTIPTLKCLRKLMCHALARTAQDTIGGVHELYSAETLTTEHAQLHPTCRR